MNSLSVAPAASAADPPPRRVLEQLREHIRYLHCSIRTEEAYVPWVRAVLALFEGHSDAPTTMIYTYVLEVAGGDVLRPLDALLQA